MSEFCGKKVWCVLGQGHSGNANHFTVNVNWVEIEGASGFAATTPQFPDVAEYADNRMDVLSLIGDTIDTLQSALGKSGHKVDNPSTK